jgi:hypothetical protein
MTLKEDADFAMELTRRLNRLVDGGGRDKARGMVEQLLELHVESDDPSLRDRAEPLLLEDEGLGVLGLLNGLLNESAGTNRPLRLTSNVDKAGLFTGFGLWVRRRPSKKSVSG